MDLQVACRAHGNDLRMGKETGHQGTCECTATPVIASRSNEGGAVCDPTTSAPSQRWRTARTHRRRILCTTKWKPFHRRCEHITKQKAYEPRLHSSTLLAATYGSLRDTLRPAHDRQRSPRMRRGASQGSLHKCLNRFANPSSKGTQAHRTFGHGVQASPLPYQPIWGHCTIERGNTARACAVAARC